VIGFVISYRFSCGYDEYWFHVPLRLSPKTEQEVAQKVAPPRSKEEMKTVMKEKRAAVDLIEGYAALAVRDVMDYHHSY